MQDVKEEIRARLNIEDVVGEYVQLKRAGRNFKGLSPFSGEKTPSFFVSPEKNIWHDFSSNKGGDVFSFVMEVEGLDFRQALELLANRAGIDLSQYDSKGGQERARLKRRLLEAHDLAARYYQQSLVKNPTALEYVFKKRKLSKQIVQDFGIGYAPTSSDALVHFLLKRGFTKHELSQGGLTNRFGGDLFRGRMMIPLMDASGRVIGFTGRIIADDEPNAPKYLNTPQTPLYDKSRHVFGLSQAKEAIRKGGYAVIVEGNLDVVSSHQAGVRQVVATAGTALTEAHLKALVRLSPTVKLSFDADAAGLAATERAIPIAQRVGVDLTIVSLPAGVKDPDELVKKDPQLWQKAIDDAENVIDWLLVQYKKREDMNTPIGKRRFTTAALAVVRAIEDPVEREYFMRKIATYTDTSLEAVQEKLATRTDATDGLATATIATKPRRRTHVVENTTQDATAYQDTMLVLTFGDTSARALLADVTEDMLATEPRQAVLRYLKQTSDLVTETPKDLHNFDTYVKILLLKADARYGQWSNEDRYFETARLVRLTITEHKQKQKDALTESLRQAEDIGNEEEAARLRRELNEIIKEISRAKK